jgi:hypothetical protein
MGLDLAVQRPIPQGYNCGCIEVNTYFLHQFFGKSCADPSRFIRGRSWDYAVRGRRGGSVVRRGAN